MGTPNYIHCTICGMSLGDDDCIVYYGPHWPDADCPSLTISDHATTRYAAVAESYDGKAILPSGLCICPPELCDLFWPTQDRAPPATMYIAIHPACEDMANRFMRTSSHAKIHSTGDLWLVLERRCASHIYVVIPRWFENGDLRFVPEIPLAETGVHSLDGYYVPRACLLRTGDDWEGWWDENPVDIPNLTADLMSNLERIDSTPDSKLFELLPNEMKNHVCSYLQDEELSLDCNYLMPQYMWAGMFFRITFLWDLDTRVVYDKTGSSKLDLENLNWEKLTRQVMSRAESSLGVQSGADEENAWGYSKVGLNVPGGFTNRRRIWQVLEEMRPSTALCKWPIESFTDAMSKHLPRY